MVRGILKLTDILFPGSKVVPWVSRYKLVCRVQVHIDVKRLCCYHPRNTAALISQDLDSVLHRAYSQGLGERWRGWQPGRRVAKRRFPGNSGRKKASRENVLLIAFLVENCLAFSTVHRNNILRLTASSWISIRCNPCIHAPFFFEPSQNSPNPSPALPFRKPTCIYTISPSSLPSFENAAGHRPEQFCAIRSGGPVSSSMIV
ncbi:hypothetical protein L207DRAFT_127280 [Hyaloscypha variabilis F]|uniref:Uncharacterized protein n=1 Tax=Hyaloscypha variabilis (strain UAMH 11265 / GT02V1 / F) TaxID=1149755 RepID=A0A2J6R8G8_HYAVF|nr:hypothetical protein L207DRAFT_127280 [Hyaloscypha variabilis F]